VIFSIEHNAGLRRKLENALGEDVRQGKRKISNNSKKSSEKATN